MLFQTQRKTVMAKIFLSLGFWMTIVLFIALGYAFDFAHGAEYSETAIDHPAIATSILQDQRVADNDLKAATSYQVDARKTRRHAATLPTFRRWRICRKAGRP